MTEAHNKADAAQIQMLSNSIMEIRGVNSSKTDLKNNLQAKVDLAKNEFQNKVIDFTTTIGNQDTKLEQMQLKAEELIQCWERDV